MKVLDSVRVLEIGGIGPGPFCAMHLADLGADVVSIVRPEAEPAATSSASSASALSRGQARVGGLAGLGSQAQALHGAGPHAFDQRIGIAHQGQHQVTPFGRLEIGEHRALAARQRGGG